MQHGHSYSLPTSVARDRLSEIITLVQDPRSTMILTRHGKPVAAIVSMPELERIWAQQDIEDIVKHGARPGYFTYGRGGGQRTRHEAAEAVQKVQLDRRAEREVLKGVGLEPIPGGELVAELDAEEVPQEVRKAAHGRRWWQRWRREA